VDESLAGCLQEGLTALGGAPTLSALIRFRGAALLTFLFAIGALVGGRLGDRFGRRKVFTVTMIGLATGTAVMAGAQNVAMLYVGTAIVGFSIGADLPVSMAIDWSRREGQLDVTVEVPCGTTAVLHLPGEHRESGTCRVEPGTHRISVPFRAPQDDPSRPAPVDRVAAAFAVAARLGASAEPVRGPS
jgi:Major Facilitator Superfamily/Bacterial alpha-L-rhamnosidase C-terminal domain